MAMAMAMEPISICPCYPKPLPIHLCSHSINAGFLRRFTSAPASALTLRRLLKLKSPTAFPSRVSCCSYGTGNCNGIGDDLSTTSWAYDVLGLDSDCTSDQLKHAFRSKVKQFHPDVVSDGEQNSDVMIRRVIRAYEILSNCSRSEIIESECMDPFDKPECEAFDVFVNEFMCIGKGCLYSCVNRASHAFQFSSTTGTARAVSQGHGEDYQVQLAVGQCPRSCIHYVTPSQRIVLEELLFSIIGMPYDTSADAELLYSLIVKATYENNRFDIPKKKANVSSKHVDWF
ncbi:chaperone protein dnaJ C76, chloroplastic [Andrographis paniculata]|uniref:chaperone protein dnaJ C76, chloroplastic n=1 Tax=Andrographis paniculata TaxID=175694 RepID=UPI0021E823C9|nr:chaperone protein dnaJ C76, chloroplastic [Andrographis paniculata]